MLIVEALKQYNYYGCSETLDIAKGIHKMPQNFKEAKDLVKRRSQWKRK